MTDSHFVQFIRVDCKICGRTFRRVPYEHILHHRIAQCSSCGASFILEREELQAALLEALNEAEKKEHAGITAETPVAIDTAREPARESISESEPPAQSELESDVAEKQQGLSTEGTFDFETYQHCEREKGPAIAQPEELTIEEGFEIGAPRILDAGESLEIEEFLDFGGGESIETEELRSPGSIDSLEIEEPQELEAEEALEIEEPQELEAEEALEIEEPQELEAEDSLEIEESQELEAEDSLEIEESQELEAEDSLEIEEPQELEAEDSLEIEEPQELEAEDRPAAEAVQEAAAPDMPVPAFFDRLADEPCVPQQPEPTAAVSAAREVSRPLTGFEPEKEDKLEFARRLSRLIPEGWVNLPASALVPPSGAGAHDETAPAIHPGDQRRQFLIFALDSSEFAVPVENTSEIGLVPEITRVPNVPDWLLGIANLRGDIVSLVDIKKFLGMGPFDAGMHDRIIMLRSFNEDLCTAVVVNRIVGMHHVADEDIIINGAGGRDSEPYIGGVYERDGRTIVILDIESMLLSDDMQQFRAL
ncbi:MAG: hypothetical protein FJ119_03910 [Deltaproteobacteria bacterium]|nr:hypothetical protein [Deltaproteobacteria bacterium]